MYPRLSSLGVRALVDKFNLLENFNSTTEALTRKDQQPAPSDDSINWAFFQELRNEAQTRKNLINNAYTVASRDQEKASPVTTEDAEEARRNAISPPDPNSPRRPLGKDDADAVLDRRPPRPPTPLLPPLDRRPDEWAKSG